MDVKIHYLEDVPHVGYAHTGDAGVDLVASGTWVVDLDMNPRDIKRDRYVIAPGERILVKTGVACEIPLGYWGNIRDRSGLAMKKGLHTLGGVIDSTYRGEIGVILINWSTKQVALEKHERVAQMIVQPCAHVTLVESQLSQTDRGATGFGASGSH